MWNHVNDTRPLGEVANRIGAWIMRYPDIERLTLTPKGPEDSWLEQPIRPTTGLIL